MADLKISQLTSLPGGSVDAGDELPIVHLGDTRKVTVKNLLEGGVDDMGSATIPSAKVNFASGSIVEASLATGAVSTAKIQADAVTGAKLANSSSAVVSSSLPASGEFTGQLHIDSDDEKASYWDGSAWVDLKAKGSVNTITGSTASLVNIAASASGDTITLDVSLDNTSAANQFLAGPAGGGGAVAYRTIDPSDLPTANSSLQGAVIVDGNGLAMDAGIIKVDNTVTAQASPVFHKIAYNAQGLVTSSSSVAGADLPVATSTSPGAVQPGSGLAVSGVGVLNHDNAVASGTVSGISYDTEGHITNAVPLVAGDIPNLDASKITTGSLDVARIAANTVTGTKLADFAITKIGDTQPTADQIGQFFFNPLTRDLFLWDGNVFQPIGISVGEIVFGGTFDASSGGGTGVVASVTSEGAAIGLTVGQPLPAAAAVNSRYYLVVSETGVITSGNAPNVTLSPPDIVLSNGNQWTEIDVSQAQASTTANQVSFTPAGSLSATNVQAALEELDTSKIDSGGGTVIGELLIGSAGSFAFEGSTDNDYETRFSVVNPTADRTVTIPDQTGNFLISGNASIVNADINASAAIADTKLATISTAGKVANSATTATNTNTPSTIVARDASGNFSASVITATSLAMPGATSGTITVTPTSSAGTTNITIPATSGTLVTTGDTSSVSDTMLAGPISGSKVTAASTSVVGVVQLTDSTSSTSTSTAATANAVKTAYDLANAALPKSGGTMSGAITFAAGQTISGYGAIDTAQTWTKGQRGEITALTDSATIAIDFADSNNFSVQLGGNRTLGNPTNQVAGQSGSIFIVQDATGNRVLSYDGNWDFAGGSAPQNTLTANAVDRIDYIVRASGSIHAILTKAYS